MLLLYRSCLPVVSSSASRFSSTSRLHCYFPLNQLEESEDIAWGGSCPCCTCDSRELICLLNFLRWNSGHMWTFGWCQRWQKFLQVLGGAAWFNLFGHWLGETMASKQRSKHNKLGLSSSNVVNSPSSSTTSSSKLYVETSIDGQSSPASSSARSKPQCFYSDSLPVDADRSKENVTVTVRFRPLRCICILAVLSSRLL